MTRVLQVERVLMVVSVPRPHTQTAIWAATYAEKWALCALFSTLKELCLVQLFPKWASNVVARYNQSSQVLDQAQFVTMHAFSVAQIQKQ